MRLGMIQPLRCKEGLLSDLNCIRIAYPKTVCCGLAFRRNAGDNGGGLRFNLHYGLHIRFGCGRGGLRFSFRFSNRPDHVKRALWVVFEFVAHRLRESTMEAERCENVCTAAGSVKSSVGTYTA